jgi:hypothetical protein
MPIGQSHATSISTTASPPANPVLKPGEVRTNDFDLTLFSIARPLSKKGCCLHASSARQSAAYDGGQLKEILSKSESILHGKPQNPYIHVHRNCRLNPIVNWKLRCSARSDVFHVAFGTLAALVTVQNKRRFTSRFVVEQSQENA